MRQHLRIMSRYDSKLNAIKVHSLPKSARILGLNERKTDEQLNYELRWEHYYLEFDDKRPKNGSSLDGDGNSRLWPREHKNVKCQMSNVRCKSSAQLFLCACDMDVSH